jgi:hypothetical protein
MVSFFFLIEIIVAVLLILAMFLSILYYAIPFVEERVNLFARFAFFWCLLALSLSFFIIPAGYGTLTFLSTFITNCAWLSVLSRKFPYISMFSLDLLIGAIGTTVCHGCWVWTILELSIGPLATLAYYLTVVWGLPILIVLGMTVTDENGARHGKGSRSIWSKLFVKIIDIVKGFIRRHKSE